ncbi:unnamed protein product [Ectocarpus sp. 12 AP-2014]
MESRYRRRAAAGAATPHAKSRRFLTAAPNLEHQAEHRLRVGQTAAAARGVQAAGLRIPAAMSDYMVPDPFLDARAAGGPPNDLRKMTATTKVHALHDNHGNGDSTAAGAVEAAPMAGGRGRGGLPYGREIAEVERDGTWDTPLKAPPLRFPRSSSALTQPDTPGGPASFVAIDAETPEHVGRQQQQQQQQPRRRAAPFLSRANAGPSASSVFDSLTPTAPASSNSTRSSSIRSADSSGTDGGRRNIDRSTGSSSHTIVRYFRGISTGAVGHEAQQQQDAKQRHLAGSVAAAAAAAAVSGRSPGSSKRGGVAALGYEAEEEEEEEAFASNNPMFDNKRRKKAQRPRDVGDVAAGGGAREEDDEASEEAFSPYRSRNSPSFGRGGGTRRSGSREEEEEETYASYSSPVYGEGRRTPKATLSRGSSGMWSGEEGEEDGDEFLARSSTPTLAWGPPQPAAKRSGRGDWEESEDDDDDNDAVEGFFSYNPMYNERRPRRAAASSSAPAMRAAATGHDDDDDEGGGDGFEPDDMSLVSISVPSLAATLGLAPSEATTGQAASISPPAAAAAAANRRDARWDAGTSSAAPKREQASEMFGRFRSAARSGAGAGASPLGRRSSAVSDASPRASAAVDGDDVAKPRLVGSSTSGGGGGSKPPFVRLPSYVDIFGSGSSSKSSSVASSSPKPVEEERGGLARGRQEEDAARKVWRGRGNVSKPPRVAPLSPHTGSPQTSSATASPVAATTARAREEVEGDLEEGGARTTRATAATATAAAAVAGGDSGAVAVVDGDADAQSLVLPCPPSDEEKIIYHHSGRLGLIMCAMISFAALTWGMWLFTMVTPAFYWFGAPAIFLIFYTACHYLGVAIWGRDFKPEVHAEVLRASEEKGYRPSVDVFLPVCKEPLHLLANTWQHVAALDYPDLKVFVLDDGASDEVKALTSKFGFEYVVREDAPALKKAGNLRNAFARTSGEAIAIFDADFCPRADFLKETVPYFGEDPTIGIVQTPQYFRHRKEQTWIEQGAGVSQEFFYRMVQVNQDRFNAAVCVGSCGLYRRTALEPLGGMAAIEHSEDMYTGYKMTENGFKIKYVPLALAMGICPNEPQSFFMQQYRWCKGSTTLVKEKGFWTSSISKRQKLCFLNGLLYYFATSLLLFMAPLPIMLLVWVEADGVLWYHSGFALPSLIFAGIILPLWSKQRYGMACHRVKIIQYYAHLYAVKDCLLGLSAPWVPSGGSRLTSARYKSSVRLMVVWSFVSSALIFGGCVWRMTMLTWYHFVPAMAFAVGTFALNMSTLVY